MGKQQQRTEYGATAVTGNTGGSGTGGGGTGTRPARRAASAAKAAPRAPTTRWSRRVHVEPSSWRSARRQTVEHHVHLERRTRDHRLRHFRNLGHAARGLERPDHLHLRAGRGGQRLRPEPHLCADRTRQRRARRQLHLRRQRESVESPGRLGDDPLRGHRAEQRRRHGHRRAARSTPLVGGGQAVGQRQFHHRHRQRRHRSAITNLTLTTNLARVAGRLDQRGAGLLLRDRELGKRMPARADLRPDGCGAAARSRSNYPTWTIRARRRTGSVNIPYSTTSANNVVAIASPAGQINAVEKTGGQAVAVTFTTDDGKAAANLVITSEPGRPAGRVAQRVEAAFSCASVSTGNGCQLGLTYAPTALGERHADARATRTPMMPASAQTGTLNLAVCRDHQRQRGRDAIAVGPDQRGGGHEGSQTVSVVFTTDDGRLATALQLTSSLTDAARRAGAAPRAPSRAPA